jgi:hypothetical protein
VGISVKGGAAFGVEVARRRLHFSRSEPEHKMASNSQNGDITTLSHTYNISYSRKRGRRITV